MSDLISRQDAINTLESLSVLDRDGMETMCKTSVADAEGWTGGLLAAIHAVEDLPSAEPERKKGEREEGEWIMHKMLSRDYGKIYYQHDCSCNLYESPYPFCPNCGMKMKRSGR